MSPDDLQAALPGLTRTETRNRIDLKGPCPLCGGGTKDKFTASFIGDQLKVVCNDCSADGRQNKLYGHVIGLGTGLTDHVEKPKTNGGGEEALLALGGRTKTYEWRDPAGRTYLNVKRTDAPYETIGAKTVRQVAVHKDVELKTPPSQLFSKRHFYGVEKASLMPDAKIVLVEGEKCADSLNSWLAANLHDDWLALAFTSAVDSFVLRPLENREVYVWRDADKAGEKARRMAERAAMVADSVMEYQPPAGRDGGWDVADLIEEDEFVDVIRHLLDRSLPLIDDSASETVEDVLKLPHDPIDMVEGLAAPGVLSLVVGPQASFKSTLVRALGAGCSNGGFRERFGHRAGSASGGRVLCLFNEESKRTIARSFRANGADPAKVTLKDIGHMTPEGVISFVVDFCVDNPDAAMVIEDNVRTGVDSENDASEVGRGLRLRSATARRFNLSWVGIHHSGKNPDDNPARGSTEYMTQPRIVAVCRDDGEFVKVNTIKNSDGKPNLWMTMNKEILDAVKLTIHDYGVEEFKKAVGVDFSDLRK